MPYSITDRLRHAWNAFTSRDPTRWHDLGYGSSFRPDRKRILIGNDRSIVTAVYNRIAVDVSQVDIRHVKTDEDGRYTETLSTGLNNVLSLEANLDQTGRQFIRDLVLSLFDEGCVAAVITDADINPTNSNAYDVNKMRVGQILEWFPEHVKVRVYNEATAKKEDIIVPKKMTAIIENPFYSIMNEPNSTLQRLIRTLNHLDVTNEQNTSGKLDLIIQLPYLINTESKRQRAEVRRKDIEMQLTGSKYGIAYTDGTERITQLNRPVENNLWKEAQDLTAMLFNQLGLTQSIFDGTADEKTMTNYYNRTVEPILSAITEEFIRKFLSKTARTQHQSIMYFQDAFKLVPVSDIAEIADKFTRNAILSSNEIRAVVGYKPVDDPAADELRNKNLNQQENEESPVVTTREGAGSSRKSRSVKKIIEEHVKT